MSSGSLFIFLLSHLMKQPTSVSLEAITGGVEKEVVMYARIGNREGLNQAASSMKQIQAQLMGPRSRIRIRYEEKDGQPPTCVMTTKKPVDHNGTQVMKETNADVSKEALEVFMISCDQVFYKTRYEFPIERATLLTKDLRAEIEVTDLKFEVDVFTVNGKESEWCKIDVEVQALIPQLEAKGLKLSDVELNLNVKISGLPFQPEAFFVDTGEKTGPMRELVTMIYEKQFITKLTD